MINVRGAERVEMTDARTDTTGLLHEEKVAPESMEGKADTPLTEEKKLSKYERVHEHAKRSIALRIVP